MRKNSILIPTYNRAQYIAGSIDSAINQIGIDNEIIVVDDGSTDDTETVLKPYKDQITYIKTPNQGPALARNTGMRLANCEYFSYLDSDDLYYPYKSLLQATILDRHPEIGMVFSEFSAFDDNQFFDEYHLKKYHESAYQRGHLDYTTIYDRKIKLTELNNLPETLIEVLPNPENIDIYFGKVYQHYLFNTIVFTNSMMFRKSLVERIGLQSVRFGMFHDLEFALRLCKMSEIAFVNIPTYQLRYHEDQISTTNKPQGGKVAIKKQQDLLRVTKVHINASPGFLNQNKKAVHAQYAKLCRAIAVPLLTQQHKSSQKNTTYSRRARKYICTAWQYGRKDVLLLLVSYLPHTMRRVFFKLHSLFKK